MSLITRTFPSTNMIDYGANKIIAFNSATMIDLMSGGFGATGNGATDDTTAINSALVAGKAAGKLVYVTNGIYMHNAAITVDASGLVGQSGNVIFRATDTEHSPVDNGDGHTWSGSSNRQINVIGTGPSVIQNIRLDGNSTIHRFTAPSSDAVHVQGSNVTIDSVTIDGGYAPLSYFTCAVHIESYDGPASISNFTITNNLSINCGSDRFRVAAWNGFTITKVRQSGNLVVNVPSGAAGDDDYSFIGNDVTTIIDVISEANVTFGPKQWGAAADIQGCVGLVFKNNYIRFEQSLHSPGIIIQVPPAYPGPGSTNIEISNNYLNGAGRNDGRGALAALSMDVGPASNVQFLYNRITNTPSGVADIGFTGTGTKSNIFVKGNINPDGSALNILNTYAGGIVTFG